MIVRSNIKKYIGAVESEEIAARFYDKYALIIQGFEVSLPFVTEADWIKMTFWSILSGQNKFFLYQAWAWAIDIIKRHTSRAWLDTNDVKWLRYER